MKRSGMTKAAVITAMLGVGIMAWAVTSSGQAVRPVPGPGSGIVTVEGTVNVGNTPTVMVGNIPTVNAAQSGNWKVTATSATPDFLQPKRPYTVAWPAGGTEPVVVAELGANGWVRVENPGRRRWVNLAQALWIEEGSGSTR